MSIYMNCILHSNFDKLILTKADLVSGYLLLRLANPNTPPVGGWVSTPLLHAWICMLSSKSSGREDRRLLREQKKKEEEGERKSEPEDAGEEDVN